MKALVRNTALTGKDPEVLRLLFKTWPGLIWRLCRNPHTPQDLLREWSSRGEIGIRTRVAANPNTPIDVVEGLTGDKVYDVTLAARLARLGRTKEYQEYLRGKK
jgi:hypothetical protein